MDSPTLPPTLPPTASAATAPVHYRSVSSLGNIGVSSEAAPSICKATPQVLLDDSPQEPR